MSLQSRRVCLVSLPKINISSPRTREFLVYLAGALFAVGWWAFLDGAIASKHAIPISDPNSPYDPVPVHVTFADWTPGIAATIGMLIVNLIDKQMLKSDGEDNSWDGAWGSGAAWKAKVFLFIGFAFMAGGLAGSVTVLVVKYVIPPYPGNFGVSYGIANVVQSLAVMLSAVVLWTAQNSESEYEYNLTL